MGGIHPGGGGAGTLTQVREGSGDGKLMQGLGVSGRNPGLGGGVQVWEEYTQVGVGRGVGGGSYRRPKLLRNLVSLR